MNKSGIYIILLKLISFSFANELPKSIEDFTTIGYNGIFNGLINENIISVKLNSGEMFTANYQGIDFDFLLDWDEKQKETGNYREIIYKLDFKHGVYLIDKESEIKITLRGLIDTHPIDLGLKDCQNQFNSNTNTS